MPLLSSNGTYGKGEWARTIFAACVMVAVTIAGGAFGASMKITAVQTKVEDQGTTFSQRDADLSSRINSVETQVSQDRVDNAQLKGEVLARLNAIDNDINELRKEIGLSQMKRGK